MIAHKTVNVVAPKVQLKVQYDASVLEGVMLSRPIAKIRPLHQMGMP